MSTSIRTPLEALQPGMVLAEPVFHPANRQQLLGPGTAITPQNLSLLYRAGIDSVAVINFQAQPVQATPRPLAAPVRQPAKTGPLGRLFGAGDAPKPASTPAPAPSRAETGALSRFAESRIEKLARDVVTHNVASIREIANTYKESASIDFEKADSCVQTTLQEIVMNKEILNSLCDLRVYDEYTYAHSANVMSLSLLMGVTLGYPVDKLRLLGIGALLHDVGKNLIPDFILNKPGKLTEAEFAVMKTHSEKGLRLIQNHRWATPEIKGIVLHHHEKWAGGGYPYGLKGNDIPEMARAVAICDVWDALISNRVYKKGMPPNQAYRIMLEGMDTHFERRMVWAFQNFIVPYPKNALVLLNSGEIAKVAQVNREDATRPVVEMDGQLIDLAKHGRLVIQDLYRPEIKA
ncbi:MAG TPA: HD domain-containing phosphohydrolase [Pantanalinema sp.]